MTKTTLSALIGKAAPLIPVLHVENADHAEPLAEALVSAGIVTLEVTLRTAAGLEVISRMRKAFPQAIVGAGTVTKPEQLAQVRDAGALFAVSPALTERMAEAAAKIAIPFLPGAVTPTEILTARELGLHELKFFPADIMGGIGALKHYLPLFPDVSFCPTGGISDANVMTYLDLDNVFTAGGAWLAPRDLIEAADWTQLHARAKASVAVVAKG
ncbi:bifunctional 4-hydroxy-2-oxoglutarate aldolase/2-dehydro-3-deoxy-phosphogluconate aldolase [Bosea caraganae]|uniref:2-dehydro-3-deoxy-phosphogluconate aldolase n=1 Tax=Bosea caraganae TaxID=2763117 RepID=A0A370L229_9HYPH|nr:bifunctional 4-hydroxy-2-oxoglutarate aldolase/2-dehydro-3-deoxy-phosphogluconate aldolase [Bosea caraganae]RDJ22192.1 bifunctional 4-hydroxy-2-oxoglutarate aldolase/2-dehydro-3-deoxy-phosphogluconate aldolase [Bosea caraganae]RDJ22721.1 bifunctional 4-hydroxy-2-oxoglutarate aldolase/2-dehydro-3-deoxy-phosphogluconate aldolase [Bosea caraganae]